MNRHALRLAAAAMLCLGMLGRSALAQEPGDVNVPPPPLRAEVVPPGPAGSVWIPGYWYWSGGHYKWVAGVWAEARPGYVWEPAHWELRNVYYHFVPGYWRPLPGPEVRTVVVEPPYPPPPPREEVVVVRPGYAWAPGYWNWDGFQYVWVTGYWRTLRPGPYWHGPYWRGSYWHGPYWRSPGPHVGVGMNFHFR